MRPFGGGDLYRARCVCPLSPPSKRRSLRSAVTPHRVAAFLFQKAYKETINAMVLVLVRLRLDNTSPKIPELSLPVPLEVCMKGKQAI